MFTGMDSLLARGRRDEVAREVRYGRPERKPRESRASSWPPAGTPSSPKIAHLRDAGIFTRT